MIGLFDKEHKTRSAGSCAFDDWFGVHEANVEEAVTTAVCMAGIIVWIVCCMVFLQLIP